MLMTLTGKISESHRLSHEAFIPITAFDPFCQETFVYHKSEDQGIVQTVRDLRRSLVQPSAHSRGSSKVRPGCSGLHPFRDWKPPRTETAQCSWATQDTAWLCSTALLTSVVALSSFHSCQSSLTLLPMWWAQFCPLCELFTGTAAAARYFQSHLCSKVSISSSPSFSPQHKFSSSHHSGGFCWIVSNSLMSSLWLYYTGVLQWVLSRGNNH